MSLTKRFFTILSQGEPEMSEENFPPESLEGVDDMDMYMNNESMMIMPTSIKLHSGLWRVCVYYEELGK